MQALSEDFVFWFLVKVKGVCFVKKGRFAGQQPSLGPTQLQKCTATKLQSPLLTCFQLHGIYTIYYPLWYALEWLVIWGRISREGQN